MSEVLVTGGGGLVGDEVCQRLLHAGHRVTATWRDAAPATAGHIRWLRRDLRDPRSLEDLDAVEVVAHCAARLPVSFAESDAVACDNARIDGTVSAFARRCGAALLYASSASVYGNETPPQGKAWKPSDPPNASGSYLQQKLRTEAEGLAHADSDGTRFVSLRINAPYGPGQRARTVLMRFVADAVAGRPLNYFGEGTREQDFTYAGDVADAFLAAMTGARGVFNVSGGQAITMRELALLVARLGGLPDTMVAAADVPDPQEHHRARFDLTASRDVLGWAPRTSLEDGIRRCLESATLAR